MVTAIIVVFALGYLAITLEHTLKIDKLIPAVAMMAICWALVALGVDDIAYWFGELGHGEGAGLIPGFADMGHDDKLHLVESTLLHHLGKTAEILVFLLGAMTIVELIDYFDGFAALKRFIRTNKRRNLLWIMSILAFILSAVIDNLTATIVLITILRKLVKDQKLRMWFAGMIVIAANAGGAWSPIGDVTTTMLWIGDKVTTGHLISNLLLPSIVCMIVPTVLAGFLPAFRGTFDPMESNAESSRYSGPMLTLGLLAILFVPVFKTVTHLPPYVGMMLSLAIVGIVAEVLSNRKVDLTNVGHGDSAGHHSPVHKALTKVEMPSILFFLGILLGVAALESIGQLYFAAQWLDTTVPNQNVVVMLLGAGSAVVDNVPLVAASMSMYSADLDAPLWHFVAYAAGTGGSMLIIGSAAGVVAMGLERISFVWYLRKISWLALIGFLAGAALILLMNPIPVS
ncbi:MAG: sodium:proton antiporter NhaD [Flavobacteriales bacterium]